MSSTRASLNQSILRSSNLRPRCDPIWGRSSSLVKLTRGTGITACLNLEVTEPRALRNSGFDDKSKEVMEAEGKVLVGTYARAPVVLASGRGCKLYDVEGREYLDLSSGIAVNALGHGDPDWVNAVVEQANTLTHVSNVYFSLPQVNIF